MGKETHNMYNPHRYQKRGDKMTTFGYAGKILRIDLSSGSTTEVSTLDYVSFLGGRGIAAKIYWDEVSPLSLIHI